MTPDQQQPPQAAPPGAGAPPASAAGPQAQPQPQPGVQPPQQGGGQAVQIYQRLRTAAMKKIFGDQNITSQVVQSLAAGKDNPPLAVAHVAMGVLEQVREKITGIPPEMVYTVAPAIIAELGVLGSAAKVFSFTPQMFGQAMQMFTQQLKSKGAQPQQPPAAAAPAQPPEPPEQPGEPADPEDTQEA